MSGTQFLSPTFLFHPTPAFTACDLYHISQLNAQLSYGDMGKVP